VRRHLLLNLVDEAETEPDLHGLSLVGVGVVVEVRKREMKPAQLGFSPLG
jgi:hypothetical protein